MARKAEKRDIAVKSRDFALIALPLGLVIFGITMVFSSSYYAAINHSGDPYFYLKREILWAGLGLCLMLFTAGFHYRNYARLARPFMWASIGLLLALVLTPFGQERGGAVRWLGVGKITLMPGEVAKIAAILYAAWFLSRDKEKARSVGGVFHLLLLCVVYAGLIIWQPNLSTAIMVCGIIVGLMFVAGMKWLHGIGIVSIGALGVYALIVADRSGYWFERLMIFTDPFSDPAGEGYQLVQSLYALGSGGLFGMGLGRGLQKNLYLPEPQNDFILAIIGEELGFIGCSFLLAAYLILIWRCAHVALNAPDLFGCLIASGITLMLALQVILNVAVVTSSMPPTGITLPFISYGGNALLLFMGSMGILLNISKQSAR